MHSGFAESVSGNVKRSIPSLDRVISDRAVAPYCEVLGRERVKRVIKGAFDRVRGGASDLKFDDLVSGVVVALENLRRQKLSPVINATGIIVHTNLGRAPLAPEALEAIVRLGRGYSNLEYDVESGSRGSRYSRLAEAIGEATGAQDALVVNNCAAAVLLVLDTFAKGREVIVARSQLVEIGGGFRVPEVLERSGATLVEVGTTNRVYVEDFERALSPRTALILRTHPSNYRIEGFTHETQAKELVALGRRAGVLVVEDLGTGALESLASYGVEAERTAGDAISDGIGLVTFSADKLLGGPQGGIIAGKASLVARLRTNPLLRALRVDKLTLAALEATLALHRTDRERVPVYRMLSATLDDLHVRARAYVAAIPRTEIAQSHGYLGGGALPGEKIASLAVAVKTAAADRFAAELRRGEPPIVARIEEGRVYFDLRTIAPEEDEVVIAALVRLVADLRE